MHQPGTPRHWPRPAHTLAGASPPSLPAVQRAHRLLLRMAQCSHWAQAVVLVRLGVQNKMQLYFYRVPCLKGRPNAGGSGDFPGSTLPSLVPWPTPGATKISCLRNEGSSGWRDSGQSGLTQHRMQITGKSTLCDVLAFARPAGKSGLERNLVLLKHLACAVLPHLSHTWPVLYCPNSHTPGLCRPAPLLTHLPLSLYATLRELTGSGFMVVYSTGPICKNLNTPGLCLCLGPASSQCPRPAAATPARNEPQH